MAAAMGILCCGCVCQKPAQTQNGTVPKSSQKSEKLVATSPAVADIANRLELDLVGVSSSAISKIPERYEKVKRVGAAMSPDMEIVKSLNPDWVLSPSTLEGDLKPKYEAAGLKSVFLDLKSVEGMYGSIKELGNKFNRKEQAKKLVEDYTSFYEDYKKKNQGKKQPKVLILMGLPGSYIAATDKSYVGSLVKMAGGQNVYREQKEDFLNANTEDMLKKDPDIILRTAHALPDDVMKMFQKEFKENDIWKHFRAVKEERVYDLDYKRFGMSAKFNYKEALNDLQPILYKECK